MNNKFQKCLIQAVCYILSIYASLYFLPSVVLYLSKIYLLNAISDAVYIIFGLTLTILSLYRYRIFHPQAIFLFAVLFGLFLLEFYNVRFLVERFHYLEYAILFGLWFRVFRYLFKGILSYGVTLWSCILFGAIDEGIQYLLPNRVFEVRDFFLNVEGVLFGMAAVAVWMAYRRDPGRGAEYVLSR